MSDRRDDEPTSIESDAPEADWIEQHQPVVDEDDANAYPSALRGDDSDISIESDAPEADWIEQHQPVVESADDEHLRSHDLAGADVDTGEADHDWTVTEAVGAADDQDVPTRSASGARGCNALAAIAHAVLRQASAATRQLERRK